MPTNADELFRREISAGDIQVTVVTLTIFKE
jgi:hypothetical protein